MGWPKYSEDIREDSEINLARIMPELYTIKFSEPTIKCLCPFCNDELSSNDELYQHMRSHHNSLPKMCYIYVTLKLDKRQIVELERILLSAFELDSKLSFDKKIGKIFPEVLLSKSPFGQIEKLAYLHHNEAKAVHELSTKLSELQTKYDDVVLNGTNLHNENSSLKDQIRILKAEASQHEKEIDSLKTEVQKTNDRLEYETHKHTEDSLAFQNAFTDKLRRRISIEIEGLNTTLEHVDEPEKSKLQRRITNIEDILAGKEK